MGASSIFIIKFELVAMSITKIMNSGMAISLAPSAWSPTLMCYLHNYLKRFAASLFLFNLSEINAHHLPSKHPRLAVPARIVHPELESTAVGERAPRHGLQGPARVPLGRQSTPTMTTGYSACPQMIAGA